MIGRNIRGALVAMTVCALPASSAQACGLWKNWFGTPATTYYAPYTAAYAPAGCGQTVNYMPQTCYRTVYVNAPVVTYRPVAACDPCTGCPTTVMRPVVSYTTQARLVPYTTYRPVVSAAAPCCGTATPVVATYAPAYAAAPVAVAAPAACCGAGAAPAGAPGATVPSLAPSLNYPGAQSPTFQSPSLQPAPATSSYPLSTPQPSAAYPQPPGPSSETLAPSADSDQQGAPADQNKTFGTPSESNKPAPESRLLLPPRNEPSNTNGALHGLDPEDRDRVTAVPLRQPWSVRTASAISVARPITPRPAQAPQQPADAWRAARP